MTINAEREQLNILDADVTSRMVIFTAPALIEGTL